MNFSIFEEIKSKLNEKILRSEIKHSILECVVEAKNLLALTEALKNEFDFDVLLDVTAVDYLNHLNKRFEVVYHLYSTKHFVRLRIKIPVGESEAHVESLRSLYGSAHFLERECHEMYGIDFKNHNDLRPILLYGGFEGYPLRKDYPIDKEQPLVDYIK